MGAQCPWDISNPNHHLNYVAVLNICTFSLWGRGVADAEIMLALLLHVWDERFLKGPKLQRVRGEAWCGGPILVS